MVCLHPLPWTSALSVEDKDTYAQTSLWNPSQRKKESNSMSGRTTLRQRLHTRDGPLERTSATRREWWARPCLGQQARPHSLNVRYGLCVSRCGQGNGYVVGAHVSLDTTSPNPLQHPALSQELRGETKSQFSNHLCFSKISFDP